jgi:predicted TIM-barrel fold metal-dependent hydrolase
MGIAGIDKSILLIADFGYSLGEAALSLQEIHALHDRVLKRFPDRFIVFGGVDPRRGPEGVDIFERSLHRFGFSGLKLYPPCGFEMDDPLLYPLYEICNQYKLPVISHTGPSLPSMRTERQYPSTILKVSEEFKDISFILAHGGANDWEVTVEIAKQRRNVYFDISTFQAGIQHPEELESRFKAFEKQCPDQVIFGTDWPMFVLSVSQKQLVDMVDGLRSISLRSKEKLFSANALEVLSKSTVVASGK